MEYTDFIEGRKSKSRYKGFNIVYENPMLFDFQNKLVSWAVKKGQAALFEDCGLGKGQPIGSKILTDKGFVRNDKLKLGDMICASDGNFYKLTGIYPKQKQDTYRIYFSDNTSFVVDSDHIHIVRTNNDRRRGKEWKNRTTSELLSCGNLRYGKNGKSRNYDIPVVSPVKYNTFYENKISPYVLGAFLGDGCLRRNITFTSPDKDVVERIKKELPDGVTLKLKDKDINYNLVTGSTGNKKHWLRKEFINLGLYNKLSHEKFIPDFYKRQSIPDRLSLLQGLMDTDGYISDCGCCQYSTSSYKLALDILDLIRSLGGIPTLNKKEVYLYGERKKDSYTVTFSLKT